MSALDFFPRARVEGLITTETTSDVLIYDAEANELHTLNAVAASVWRAADGTRPVSELASIVGLDEPALELALGHLAAANLMVNAPEPSLATGRRRFLKKAAMVSVPVIVSVSVPLARAAASCTDTPYHNKYCPVIGAPCWTGSGVGKGQCGTCKEKDADENHCDNS